MKTPRRALLLPASILVTAIAGCSWVSLSPGGERVRLMKPEEVTVCQKLGRTTATTSTTVLGFIFGALGIISETSVTSMMVGQIIVSILGSALTYPFLAGVNLVGIRRAADLPVSFNDVFKGLGLFVPLLITALLQGSHAAYYGFSAIYWKAEGYGGTLIGYLWALGVVAEVLMFMAMRRILLRFSRVNNL